MIKFHYQKSSTIKKNPKNSLKKLPRIKNFPLNNFFFNNCFQKQFSSKTSLLLVTKLFLFVFFLQGILLRGTRNLITKLSTFIY